MVALHFFATGNVQLVNADVHNISRASVSHITRDVTACLNRVCNQFIKMPTDQAELHTIMQGFCDIANFPNIAMSQNPCIIVCKGSTCNDTENACDLIVDLWRSLWNILQRFVIKGRESLYLRIMSASSK
jgi:hypothetical protein